MTSSALEIPLSDSRFGWPQNKRCEELEKLRKEPTGKTHRIVFKGQNTDLSIVRVQIALPKYRMANGRTSSLQSEHLATNPSVRKDLFSGDPELLDAQEAQHKLLIKVIKQQDLRKHFEDTSHKQVEPILLDEKGFVVNGNRRLCCWRELLHEDAGKYGHFAYIDVVVLPHCDEKDIDRLEAWLQIQKDIKADYNWDARANMLLDKQKRDGFSNKELAELYGIKEGEVAELLDMRGYADEYLRSRGKQDMWSLISEHEEAFRKIVSSRPKIDDVGDQQLFQQAAYALIDKPMEAGGRLYEQIPSILSSLDEVRDKLADEFPVTPLVPSQEAEDMFGGGCAVASESSALSTPLSVEIAKDANVDKARRIIVEVIASQKELKKNSKAAEYLIECCKKASAQLTAAVNEGLRPESKRSGVAKQLEAIEKSIARIRKHLDDHADD
jgi:ribosomal protein S15P/S13E